MKITIKEILDETEFTLGIWSSRLKVCRGIRNNFEKKLIQEVIDFKDERETEYYSDNGYADLIDKIWDEYEGEDLSSSHGHHENLRFISDFIVAFGERIKEARVNLKKEKIKEMKKDIINLEKEIKEGI